MRWSPILRLSILLVALLAAGMFTVQNLSRTTLLSFDVYLYAWRLASPVAVPALIWGSFLSGFAVAGLMGWMRRSGLARTVSRLEQEALLRSAGRPAGAAPPADATASPGDDWGR
ncbi:MAG: hypothetical protein EXR69_03345 [Myxococcales bacterium]|nr:hypothetical protein [Myxococcales bacterium]